MVKRYQFISVVWFLLAGGLTFIALPAHSQQKLRIVTEIVDPFQVVKNDQVTGIAVEHIRGIFNKAKLDMPKVEAHPWSRAFKIAKERPNTFIFGMVKTAEREPDFEWVGKFAETSFYLFGLKSNRHIRIKTLQDVKRYSIALRRGDVSYEYFRKHGFYESENVLLVFEREIVDRLFFNNKLDLIISSPFLMSQQAQIYKADINLFEPKFRLSDLDVDFYLAAHPKTDKALIRKLREHWPKEHLQY